MVRILKLNSKVGIVGSRLHYEDNTLQHSGIFMYLNQIDKTINVTHNNSNSYFNYVVDDREVAVNTAALMMVRKDLFINIGMFNELYNHCWEDVELNLQCILKGYINIVSGKSVAFHYESKTRNIGEENTEITSQYNNILIPFIQKNVDKLKKYFYIKQ
jgi:GT2 family glycosyltransferase